MEGNNASLRIGGGTTPDVQTGDTHRHGPYTNKYQELEMDEAQRQLRLRPNKLPSCSRQTVMDRACDAWLATNQDNQMDEWIENGILNALDGSEDKKSDQN